jgi:hypothetical protein
MKTNGIRLYGYRQQMLIQPESLPNPSFDTIAIHGPAK